MNCPNRRKVPGVPTRRDDVALESGNPSDLKDAAHSKAVSRSACHRTPGRKRAIEGSLPRSFILICCLFAASNCGAQFTNLWKVRLPGWHSDATPAIATNGTLY